MCSRIFVTPGNPLKLLLAQFGLDGADLPEINNLAPTEAAPVIYRDGNNFNISPMRWWLHPAWSPESPNQKFAMFNARIETVLTSRAFQGAVRHRRAIIPASGFVEFKTQGKQKQPFYVQAASGEALAVAVIWECWQNQVWSTAMITQAASESFAEVHDRMPLSLNAEQVARWMNPEQEVKSLLQELRGQSAELHWRPVDPRVNNARNKEGVVFL
jgi:putative SOS response-associated peptidase YedK